MTLFGVPVRKRKGVLRASKNGLTITVSPKVKGFLCCFDYHGYRPAEAYGRTFDEAVLYARSVFLGFIETMSHEEWEKISFIGIGEISQC